MINLIDTFKNNTTNWIDKINEDEWFFSKMKENITANLKASDAFELIPQAVELTILQTDEYLCSEAFSILLLLVRISATTEIHNTLDMKWEELINHVSKYGDYHKNQIIELKKWYRKLE